MRGRSHGVGLDCKALTERAEQGLVGALAVGNVLSRVAEVELREIPDKFREKRNTKALATRRSHLKTATQPPKVGGGFSSARVGGVNMNRIRKRMILERVEPVTEIASVVADALDRLADEVAAVAGALSYLAAAKHSGTAGEQRILGGVIYHTGRQRFGGVKYDGEPIDQMTIDSLEKTFRKLLRKP